MLKITYKNIKDSALDWIVAIFLVSNSLCWGLTFLPNPMVIIMSLVLVALLVFRPSALSNSKIWLIVCLVLLLFLYGYLIHGFGKWWLAYFIEFLMVGVLGLFLGKTNFSIVKVFRHICYLSVPAAIFVYGMNMGEMDYGQWMGVSYGCVKYIIVFIIALFCPLGILKKKWQKILAILFLLFFLQFFLLYGSRGAILGVFIAIMLIWSVQHNYRIKKLLILALITAASIILMWDIVFPIISQYFANNGIDSFAVSKMGELKDITNGRSDLLSQGLKIFDENPIIGQGVTTFESKYNMYAHNIFIQIMCDGGLLYLIAFLYILSLSFKIAFKPSNSIDIRIFIIFLLSGYVVELLFSNYLWRSHGLWLLIGFVVSHYKKRSVRSIRNYNGISGN